ncbi:thioredoxin-like domain-containing protein [Sphingobacterium sp. BIGb0116]|uniref:TlpA family protein disulfide reductase n=1 Tax=Sphingobacterium sp. BIGb0116 TaxID=2940619 RepID=UPI002169B015|nr:thioredoxin-like domain-containing protein [Sphingobacterium sp. BIGb0116]MCS4165173.1 hypothetical protein [Sphingobacterium sp. BIGb0116]
MKKTLLYLIATLFLSLFIILGFAQNISAKKYRIKLKIDYELNQPGDSVTLLFNPQEALTMQQIAIVDSSGICSFDLEQEFPFGKFSIEKFKKHKRNDHRMIVYKLYWEAGDDITFKIKDNLIVNDYSTNLIISGPGAEKYKLQYSLRKELETIYQEAQTKNSVSADSLKYLEQLEYQLYSVLNKSKDKINPFLYDVLKTDILMVRYDPIIDNYISFRLGYAKESPEKRNQHIDTIHKVLTNIKKFPVSDSAIAASGRFQRAFGELFYSTALLKNNPPDLKTSLREIVHYFPGVQKESGLLSLLKQYGLTKNQTELVEIKKSVKTFPYNAILNKLLVQKRRNVYGYTFMDTSRNLIDLNQYKGKYLLIDFWYTGCGACAVYYQNTLSKIEEEFKDHSKFAAVSISADRDFNKWLKSIPINRYTNTDAINLNTGLLGNKHQFAEDIGQWKYPFIILVDPDGNIVEYDTNSISTTKELLRETLKKYLQ